jgi:hypothetical protein
MRVNISQLPILIKYTELRAALFRKKYISILMRPFGDVPSPPRHYRPFDLPVLPVRRG